MWLLRRLSPELCVGCMKKKKPATRATVAKIDKLLDQHIKLWDISDDVGGEPAQVVCLGGSGPNTVIALLFPDGRWNVTGLYSDSWRGCKLGKYNIYVSTFVRALRMLGRISAEEEEVFDRWKERALAKERRDDALLQTRNAAAALGYRLVKHAGNT